MKTEQQSSGNGARFSHRCRMLLRRLFRDRSGAVSFLVAAGMPVMLGMAGLGVEVGLLYSEQRRLQIAADAATIAGGLEMLRRGVTGNEQVVAAARAAAALNGAVNGENDTAVDVTSTFSPTAGALPRVDVTIRRTHKPILLAVVSQSDIAVGATSAAVLQQEGVCLLALGTNGESVGIRLSQNIQSPNCSIASNLTGRYAVQADSYAAGTIYTAISAGGYQKDSSALTQQAGYRDYVRPVTDPHAGKVTFTSTQLPAAVASAPCRAQTVPGTVNEIHITAPDALYYPSRYCRSIVVKSGGVLNLYPGTYYFDSAPLVAAGQPTAGSFIIENGGQVVCTICGSTGGVTLVFMSSSSTVRPGTLQVRAGGQINLRAPRAGSATISFRQDPYATGYFVNPFPGMVVVQADYPLISAGPMQIVGSNDSIRLTGLVYLPRSPITVSGASTPGNCLQIIASSIQIYGGGETTRLEQSGCSTLGLPLITANAAPRLVR